MSAKATIPRPIIDCIAQGRAPDVQEFCVVAEHIRSDLRGHLSAAADETMVPDGAVRLLSFRAAHAALAGCV